MPTHNFRELLEAMPVERQQRIEKRFEKSLAAMPLDQLRKAQQMTQLRVAESLGVNQGEVSKIEHRSDICISTLADYIEAIGGAAGDPRRFQRSGSADHPIRGACEVRLAFGLPPGRVNAQSETESALPLHCTAVRRGVSLSCCRVTSAKDSETALAFSR
jgi:transcriptional regulator with XRE-family HTH domain